MNKIFHVLIGFLLLISNKHYAQQDSSHQKSNFIIKTDVFLPAIFLIDNGLTKNPYDKYYVESLTIEKGFFNRQSLQLTGLFANGIGGFDFQIITEY